MNKLKLLTDFINRVVTDKRLTTSHLSLSIALCHTWIDSGFNESYQISRRQIMHLSHIHSIATYHKVIKDLQKFAYLKYSPSYHPIKGSSVKLIVSDFSKNSTNHESVVV
ncbi:MAG: hypothetical protein C0523_09380 [Cytophaga sp.]|nr:hypothetical protein [Cytophaga sp.]